MGVLLCSNILHSCTLMINCGGYTIRFNGYGWPPLYSCTGCLQKDPTGRVVFLCSHLLYGHHSPASVHVGNSWQLLVFKKLTLKHWPWFPQPYFYTVITFEFWFQVRNHSLLGHFLCVLAASFRPYVRQPDNHIICWATSMPFTSNYPTHPRTNP